MIKPNATILDATAGNRSMWKTRESDYILWIDIEPELSEKPDILMDCTKTEFENGRFHTIFFDPPHSYGHTKNTGVHQTPSRQTMKEKGWGTGAYYGFDKYPTKTALLSFIHRAQEEFYRVLDDNGILWLKWGELRSSLNGILPLFKKWNVMMQFEVAYRGQVKGCRTWWIMLMKKIAV